MIAKAQLGDRNILNYLRVPALLEAALVCFRKTYGLFFYIKKTIRCEISSDWDRVTLCSIISVSSLVA